MRITVAPTTASSTETPWWTSSVIRAALVSVLSWGLSFATKKGWISISISAESIVDPLLVVIGAGASIFAIFKRVQKPVNTPIAAGVLPTVVSKT